MHKGTFYAVSAYTIWGLLPLYWKLLDHVPSTEVLAHRMIWSLLLLAAALAARRQWGWLATLREKRARRIYGTTAVLLSINWGVYIWAVNNGYIVDASLGYFINPLFSVVLGYFFLGERPRRWQWVAIGVATAGVLYLTLQYRGLPWIGLTLAGTFGVYGLLRKKAPLPSLPALSLETAVMFLPALVFLGWRAAAGSQTFTDPNLSTWLLLPLTGAATAVPLLFFGAAAPRVTLTTLGILQYIAPTGQFLLGVFVYHEPFSQARLIGFAFIWLGLAIYTGELIARGRRRMQREA
jgi:chloramphenicol-sensitive protein RarD